MPNAKMVTLDELAQKSEELRSQGKVVVQCHGCFDLIHPGHIKHLEAAKRFGDILVVTITPDRFVNKGPGRPVFNENLRMESVAALEYVDFVALNKWDDAVETIRLVKPNFYVKGKDYSDASKDITGRIVEEEQAVKEVGGSIRFTDEITFSSSKLINEHFSIIPDDAKSYLEGLKEKYTSQDIIGFLKNLSKLNVLVIGEPILDEYIYCFAVGKPEKASIVSTKFLYSELYAGGALAVSNHVSRFVKNVHLVGTIGHGEENQRNDIIDRLRKNVKPTFIERPDAPTIKKTRYIEKGSNNKMFEVTMINDQPLSQDKEDEVISSIQEKIEKEKIDMIIVCDFGHGLFTDRIIDLLAETPIFIAVNAQTNSMNFGFNFITRYRSVDYISIDERELRLPFHDKYGDVRLLVRKLANKVQCNNINITLGRDGSMLLVDDDLFFVPIFSDRVVDTIGAGDAVLSITSMLVKENVPPETIPFIGNLVGALAVLIVGNKESINPIKLFKFIEYVMK